MNNTPELSSSNPNLKDMIQLTLPFPSDIRRCDKNYFRRGLGVSQSEPNWHTFSPFSGILAHKSARLVRKGREKRCLQYSYGRAASVNEKQWMYFLNRKQGGASIGSLLHNDRCPRPRPTHHYHQPLLLLQQQAVAVSQ